MKAILKYFTEEEKKAFMSKIKAEKQKEVADNKTIQK